MSDVAQAVTLDDVCKLLTQVRDLLDAQAHPQAELLTRDAVARLLSVGVSTFDRLRAAGKVGPEAVELAGVKFVANEVRAWVTNRDHTGELYDADSWPAIWAALQTRGKQR